MPSKTPATGYLNLEALAIGPEEMLFLEVHETTAHAIGGRRFVDLGDSVLLHSPDEREPLFNRLAGIRWPDDESAFDRRIGETITLFGGLDRRPHLWLAPMFNTPSDLGRRLEAHGFVDQGGAYTMVLADPSIAMASQPVAPGVEAIRIDELAGAAAIAAAEELTDVVIDSFTIAPELHDVLAADAVAAMQSPNVHFYLVRVEGYAVAVGKRYTFDGASYFSSIGTRPRWRGRRLGELITRTMIRDALAARSRFTYLGVFSENERARSLYERLGFAIVGGRAADYLLE